MKTKYQEIQAWNIRDQNCSMWNYYCSYFTGQTASSISVTSKMDLVSASGHFLHQTLVHSLWVAFIHIKFFGESAGERSTSLYFGAAILRGLFNEYCLVSVFVTYETKQISEEVKTVWYKKQLQRCMQFNFIQFEYKHVVNTLEMCFH